MAVSWRFHGGFMAVSAVSKRFNRFITVSAVSANSFRKQTPFSSLHFSKFRLKTEPLPRNLALKNGSGAVIHTKIHTKPYPFVSLRLDASLVTPRKCNADEYAHYPSGPFTSPSVCNSPHNSPDTQKPKRTTPDHHNLALTPSDPFVSTQVQ